MVNCYMLAVCQLRDSHMKDQINCRRQDLMAEGLLKIFCIFIEHWCGVHEMKVL